MVLAAVAGVGALVWKSRLPTQAPTATAASTLDAQNRGAIGVKSDPPGAAIWINGDLRPETTPATISQLPTGRPIEVKLTKDGFERASEELSLQ